MRKSSRKTEKMPPSPNPLKKHQPTNQTKKNRKTLTYLGKLEETNPETHSTNVPGLYLQLLGVCY